MRSPSNYLPLLVSIVLGVAFLHVQSFLLVELGGPITVTLVESIVHLGLKPHVSLLMRSSNAVIWFAISGIVFGIPLGGVAKTRILRYWLVFVAAASLTHGVLSYWSEFGLGTLLSTWALPEYWVYLLGVLCFASLTPWIQRRIARTARATAP
jgi:hypothetical protein